MRGWRVLPSGFGQSVAPGVLGLRLVFLVALLGTSLCVVRATWVLFEDRLAVGIAAIWVNTALLYGVGAVFAGPAALGAFFLTAVCLAVCREFAPAKARAVNGFRRMSVRDDMDRSAGFALYLPGLALAGGTSENRRVMTGRQ